MGEGWVEVHILGPLQVVTDDGRQQRLGPRQAKLLAALVLAGGATVTMGSLIETVWEDSPPRPRGGKPTTRSGSCASTCRWSPRRTVIGSRPALSAYQQLRARLADQLGRKAELKQLTSLLGHAAGTGADGDRGDLRHGRRGQAEPRNLTHIFLGARPRAIGTSSTDNRRAGTPYGWPSS
jgi:hypothetical protein